MIERPIDEVVFEIAGRLAGAAARLTIADRLDGAAAALDHVLDDLAFEAARLRAVVAIERAGLARLRRPAAHSVTRGGSA